MKFNTTKIEGVFEVELELKEDERGYFARVFDEEEIKKQGIDFCVRQSNRSFSKTKGTVRGMHFQNAPRWEAKLFGVLRGALYTIVADLRPDSPTYKQWVGVELSADNKKMLLTPAGCANGFQTLEDNTEVLYFMSEFYSPEHASGFSYKDPQFNFVWPLGEPSVISEKDKALPNFTV
jgi:dTDP-4-dehydrorhamnose 3,5-epimerase